MDTEGSEEKTTNVYQKLIEEEKVIAIVGPDSSKCMLAAAPIAQNAEVPGHHHLRHQHRCYRSRQLHLPCLLHRPVPGFRCCGLLLDQQGYKTACIMFNNADAYAVGLKDAFVENFKGGKSSPSKSTPAPTSRTTTCS